MQSTASLEPQILEPATVQGRDKSRWSKQVAEALADWFGGAFSVLDGRTGEWLYRAADHRRADWGVQAEICREVARRGQPEFVAEEASCLLLAVPVKGNKDDCLVAVGVFLEAAACGADAQSSASVEALLGLDAAEAAAWVSRQRPQHSEMLLRLARVAAGKLANDRTIAQLQHEVESLSAHLGATFEEINLLFRLTQNLKLSSNDEELGRLALEWLAEVVPAQGLALLLTASAEPESVTSDSRTEPVLLTHGDRPLQVEQFVRLADELGASARSRPLVLNRAMTERPEWSLPAVHELVVVPVAEGEHVFGWLAALNHSHGGEFGTAEASLLGSVGTILGIHSGNIELYRQQAELLAGVVRAMTSAIDAKDPYTRGHSDRVARVAVRLAQELGCDAETQKTIYMSGLLHDIGKIGINDEVLRKPGKLTADEFEHIKTHVEIGYRILLDLRKMAPMLPVVLHHHESWDGSGYPHGLAGEDIPYLARIVAVADAFDAMASDRPYRAGMEELKLDTIIRQGADRQWDARVVEAFFRARDDIRAISRGLSIKAEPAELPFAKA